MIIVLGTDVYGGETVCDGMNMNYIGKRVHVMKHTHGRCTVDAFDKTLH